MPRPVRWLLRALLVCVQLGLVVAGAVAVAAYSVYSTVGEVFQAAEVVVPDLIDLDLDSATRKLAREDLVLRIEARRPHEVVEAGHVFFQEPAPGARTRKHRHVGVVLSVGPQRLEVPELVGSSSRHAVLDLGRKGLAPGEVMQVHSSRVRGNEVIAQEPSFGLRVEDGARVDLLVSKGARPLAFVMPDLSGRTVLEVEAAFAAAGLPITEIEERHLPGMSGGRVFQQEPPVGSRVTGDTAVRLVISSRVETALPGLRGRPRFFTE
ncbi:MAG: PASTA domain-containing protein [Acidobacteriota bacterium]